MGSDGPLAVTEKPNLSCLDTGAGPHLSPGAADCTRSFNKQQIHQQSEKKKKKASLYS